jgi:hypothetical protein
VESWTNYKSFYGHFLWHVLTLFGISEQWSSSGPPGQAQLASSTNGQWTMASNRGPNAISSESYRTGTNSVPSGVGGSWGNPSPASVPTSSTQPYHQNHSPVVHISGHPGEANTSGTFEKNLIMELCPPGGMKPEPPADKLANFCQSLPDLNSDLVCPALLDMLEDGQPWIIRAKVLCVMEKCIHVGEEMAKTSGNNVYADFFHMCREEIVPLANHTRAAVREPAKRVCKMLGLNIPSVDTSATNTNVPNRPVTASHAVQQSVVEAPNLLDFDEPAAPTETANTDDLPPVPKDLPPSPPVPAPPTLSAAPLAPSVSQTTQGNLFGGMTVKSSNPSNVQPVNNATTVSAAPPADADLLGDIKDENIAPSSSNATAKKPDSNALFDNVVVKDSSENVEVRLLFSFLFSICMNIVMSHIMDTSLP